MTKFRNFTSTGLRLTKIWILIFALLMAAKNGWAEEIKKEEVVTQKGLSMKVETFNDQVFFVTVRIETQTDRGISVGTGFVIEREIDKDKRILFLVTNKHVIKGAKSGTFFFIKSDGTGPLLGEKYDIGVENFEASWYGHSDADTDVAIMPLGPILNEISKKGWKIFFRSIPMNMFPSDQEVSELDAVEQVLFVGYPSGIFDGKNHLPIVRKGTTATPVMVDYNGHPHFLIDASVFGGSSGSPVFSGGGAFKSARNGGIILGGNKPLLLGLVSGTFSRRENGKIEFIQIPTELAPVFQYEQLLNLGLVVKSKAIVETVDAWLKQNNIQVAGKQTEMPTAAS